MTPEAKVAGALANASNRFVRRRSLYLHRTLEGLLFAFALFLALHAVASEDDMIFRVLCIAGILISLYFLCVLELRWLARHRMPLFGNAGLPQHQAPTPGISTGKLRGATWRSLWDIWYRYSWSDNRRLIAEEGKVFLGKVSDEQRLFGVLGPRLVGFKPPRHVLMVAPTRAGKGLMGIIPNLLMLPNPVIVVDPKGELARVTAARRGHGKDQFPRSRVVEWMGQDVQIIDPYGTTQGMGNATFNPVAEIDPAAPNAVALAGALARSLVLADAASNDTAFQDRARELVQALILHVLTVEDPEQRHLVRVWELLSAGDREYLAMLEAEAIRQDVDIDITTPMEALFAIMASNPAFGGLIAAIGTEMRELAPETRDGILFYARREMGFLKDPQIQTAFLRSTFRLADVFDRKISIYLCLPVMKITGDQRRVLLMFLNLILETLEGVHKPREHPFVIIDEFPALGYLEPLERAMGLVRYRITLWLIMQDISLIRKLYKDGWEAFMSNSSTIALRVANLETATWLSALTGSVIGPHGVEPLIAPHELNGPFSDDRDRRMLLIDGVPALIEGEPYITRFPTTMYDAD